MIWLTGMGTQIKMVSVAQPRFGFHPVNTIRLSARAARLCINDARIDPFDLGLIINTGIYRYKNTGEPAIAALIQERISSNRTSRKYAGAKRTFSFDLNNGGCGLITGMEIVHEFVSNGELSYGMVVSGDSEPFFGLSKEFTFNPSAAAIILTGSADTKGFSMFRTYSYPEYSELFASCTLFNNASRYTKGII
jgi:3-oxoacyl-[acyl-carrier-protein] synthase-3